MITKNVETAEKLIQDLLRPLQNFEQEHGVKASSLGFNPETLNLLFSRGEQPIELYGLKVVIDESVPIGQVEFRDSIRLYEETEKLFVGRIARALSVPITIAVSSPMGSSVNESRFRDES